MTVLDVVISGGEFASSFFENKKTTEIEIKANPSVGIVMKYSPHLKQCINSGLLLLKNDTTFFSTPCPINAEGTESHVYLCTKFTTIVHEKKGWWSSLCSHSMQYYLQAKTKKTISPDGSLWIIMHYYIGPQVSMCFGLSHFLINIMNFYHPMPLTVLI